MNAKEAILDFINYLFMLILVSGSIMYFIIPGNFERFQGIISSLAPLAFFILALLIKIKLARTERLERLEKQETELGLRLNVMHKIWYELTSILLPIVLLSVASLSGSANLTDAVLAMVAYLFMWLMGKMIFNRKNQI